MDRNLLLTLRDVIVVVCLVAAAAAIVRSHATGTHADHRPLMTPVTQQTVVARHTPTLTATASDPKGRR
jgi:hypothetical protein